MQSAWRVEEHGQVISTNSMARERARAGDAGRLAIRAEEQVGGRGRMGRGWVAPPGSSLLVSLLVRPRIPARDAFLLTVAAASALCAAVERAAGVPARLKWPNDLLLAGPDGRARKAAGILSEVEIEGGAVAWAVIGVGVNLSWRPSGVVDGRDLAEAATSVAAAGGAAVAPSALLEALLAELDARLVLLGDAGALLAEWRGRLDTLGRRVTVQIGERALSGVAEGVDASGALLLRDDNGALHTVMSGDVGA